MTSSANEKRWALPPPPPEDPAECSGEFLVRPRPPSEMDWIAEEMPDFDLDTLQSSWLRLSTPTLAPEVHFSTIQPTVENSSVEPADSNLQTERPASAAPEGSLEVYSSLIAPTAPPPPESPETLPAPPWTTPPPADSDAE